ncbi:MAG: hypothetical protein FJ037_10085 [Chloroflexi bacterium]|nr:hypothetical protein [Chloroflexota bacterium]
MPSTTASHAHRRFRGDGRRSGLTAAAGVVAGVTPHLLHHVVPFVGAAVLTGVGGTVMFAALGLVLLIPSLLQIKRRFHTWTAPALALTVFAAMFTVSTVWVGPMLRAVFDEPGTPSEPPSLHEAHHPG